MQGTSIYSPARLCFHNQDSRGGGGLSYLDEFKLENIVKLWCDPLSVILYVSNVKNIAQVPYLYVDWSTSSNNWKKKLRTKWIHIYLGVRAKNGRVLNDHLLKNELGVYTVSKDTHHEFIGFPGLWLRVKVKWPRLDRIWSLKLETGCKKKKKKKNQ